MASGYGDFTAKHAVQGVIRLNNTTFVPLVTNSDGITPLNGRRHIRIQMKSKPGTGIALEYVVKNADGTFTTPTTNVGDCTVYPGNTRIIEPVSDVVQVFGKIANKAGSVDASARAIITEYR